MPQFRKKPVVIEARQVSQASITEIWDWVGAKEGMIKSIPIPIQTAEGTMMAQEGDWVIQGVEGEFYPCKPSIFDATYEPVEKGEEATMSEAVPEEETPVEPTPVVEEEAADDEAEAEDTAEPEE